MSVIKLKNFSFSYLNDRCVLSNINLEVARGEFVVLTGLVGSGKSTLLHNLVPSLYPAGDREGEAIAQNPAFVFQDIDSQIIFDDIFRELAFSMENHGMSEEEMRSKIDETIAFFNMQSWVGLKTSELSGGQKQILNLASALIYGADVLLLDEPTSQLDTSARDIFLQALHRIREQCETTVFVATHTPEEFISFAPRTLRLTDGDIQEFKLADAESCVCSATQCERLVNHERLAKYECSTNSSTCALKVQGAYVRYAPKSTWILKALDFCVNQGSITAIVGDNGCGKTTLLKTIAGIIKPDKGKVLNENIDNQAYLPQNPKLLFACDTVGEEFLEWQDPNAMAPIPEIFADKLDMHPFDLSCGEQQLLALTKLAALSPRLLLLDEPVKSLDMSSQRYVHKIMQQAASASATIVFATHDMEFARCVADEIVLMKQGRIEQEIEECPLNRGEEQEIA